MKSRLIIGLCLVIGGFSFRLIPAAREAPEKAIAQTLVRQIDSFTDLLQQRLRPAVIGNLPVQRLQQLFMESRLAYKKFEWAAEYFNPAVARLINGAPVPEAEPVSPMEPERFRVLEPRGLQVIEGLLYPVYDSTRKEEIVSRLKQLTTDCEKYKLYFNNIDILNGQVFDATKLEVFRILTLGLAGFDAPLSRNGIQEAAVSLESIQRALSHYAIQEDGEELNSTFKAAIAYLRANQDFDSFDRAVFITDYGNMLTLRITRLCQQLKIPLIRYNRLLRQDAATLFDKDAFDADAYAPGTEYLTNGSKIALGKKLFSDVLLSGTQIRSCASCHQPDKAFADGLIKNTAINNQGVLLRNTPTLLNAALQPSQFYDGRAATLEDQVRDVVQNPMEMQCTVKTIAARLWKDTLYRSLFAEAYPLPGRTAIDTLEVMNALSVYIRSLVRLNSRFDDYMRGDTMALNRQEIRGFNLFMGKARCGTCHYMPLFNGTLPPRYTQMETEVIGVPGPGEKKDIDEDMGRYGIVPAPFLQHAFKTTTVRNSTRTAPYMHNGVFASLQDVINFYNNGGGAGLGLKIGNQTLAADSLHLDGAEADALIAFIKSLDSR